MIISNSLPQEDLPLVRGPALTALLLLLLCAALLGGAYYFRHQQQQAVQNAQGEREQAEQLLRQTVAEEEEIRRYLRPYQELAQSGVMGDEDRIALVERVEQIRDSYRLFPVQVDIEPRFAIPIAALDEAEPPPPVALGQDLAGLGPLLQATPVRLSLSLLHEEDLIHLLDRLHSLPGLLVTESCNVALAPAAMKAADRELPENLLASCRLLWLTLHEGGPPTP